MLFVQSGYEISNGKSYIVILREKQPDLFLVTGYCVNATEEGRFKSEYEAYQNQKNSLHR